MIICFLKYSAQPNPNINKTIKSYLSFRDSFKLLSNKKLCLLAIYAGLMVDIVVNSLLFLEQVYKVSDSLAANIIVMMFIGIAVGGPSHGFIDRLFGVCK